MKDNRKYKIKVLAIESSLSDYALEYLSQLAEANNDKIIIRNMYMAGTIIEQHYNNWTNNSNLYSYRKTVNGIKTKTPK